MDPIKILFKEYETLRAEIITAMNSRNSILSFGLATIGAIFTASIAVYTVKAYSLLSSLMLILAVPTINIFVLFIWLGEYQRMQRAGKFLVDLERRINEEANKELLSWETSLRIQRRHMRYPYDTTVMLLNIISLLSIMIGFIMIIPSIRVVAILLSLGILFHLLLYTYVVRKMARLRL